MTERPLHVCYFGTYRANYARNRILIDGLRRSGIEVEECHATLWQGVEDRVRVASGGWLKPSFWWRVLRTYWNLLRRYSQAGDYDILIVGYPGQYDIFLARLLSWLRRRPLVWDVLNSMYLIASERGIAARHPFTARIIRHLEGLACRLPDLLILDTKEFVSWFERTHRLSPERFRLVQIGVDDQVFQEMNTDNSQAEPSSGEGIFRVLYYGSYIRNHGVPVIVEAANILKGDPSILFELVGTGPEREQAQALAEGYQLPNLKFVEWLEKPDLARKLAQCDVCLGTFGDTPQAMVTNNNKIYEGFALKKAVISGATPALPDMLKHGEHLYLCERGSPTSLVDAIRTLQADPLLRRQLGENGHRIVYEHFDVAHIGRTFACHLQNLARAKNRSKAQT